MKRLTLFFVAALMCSCSTVKDVVGTADDAVRSVPLVGDVYGIGSDVVGTVYGAGEGVVEGVADTVTGVFKDEPE